MVIVKTKSITFYRHANLQRNLHMLFYQNHLDDGFLMLKSVLFHYVNMGTSQFLRDFRLAIPMQSYLLGDKSIEKIHLPL